MAPAPPELHRLQAAQGSCPNLFLGASDEKAASLHRVGGPALEPCLNVGRGLAPQDEPGGWTWSGQAPGKATSARLGLVLSPGLKCSGNKPRPQGELTGLSAGGKSWPRPNLTRRGLSPSPGRAPWPGLSPSPALSPWPGLAPSPALSPWTGLAPSPALAHQHLCLWEAQSRSGAPTHPLCSPHHWLWGPPAAWPACPSPSARRPVYCRLMLFLTRASTRPVYPDRHPALRSHPPWTGCPRDCRGTWPAVVPGTRQAKGPTPGGALLSRGSRPSVDMRWGWPGVRLRGRLGRCGSVREGQGGPGRGPCRGFPPSLRGGLGPGEPWRGQLAVQQGLGLEAPQQGSRLGSCEASRSPEPSTAQRLVPWAWGSAHWLWD